jgi:hypothetical protein
MAPLPRVLISYSHDSTEHKEGLLRLARPLRKDGIAAKIDQYVGGGRRSGGWPSWMLDKLDWAECWLLICVETFYRRFHHYTLALPAMVNVGGIDFSGHLGGSLCVS